MHGGIQTSAAQELDAAVIAEAECIECSQAVDDEFSDAIIEDIDANGDFANAEETAGQEEDLAGSENEADVETQQTDKIQDSAVLESLTFEIEDITVLDEYEADTELVLLDEEETSGKCGDNATWKLEGTTLTISGTGAIEWSWEQWNEASRWGTYNVYNITEIVIEEGITELKTTELTEPEGNRKVSVGTFAGFVELEKITIPDTVIQIGASAFAECVSLTEIDLPPNLTEISENVFNSCTALTKLELPEGVKKIGGGAFRSCTNLLTIKLPDGITDIGENAFTYCFDLAEINLPSGLKQIESEAFYCCSALKEIDIPFGVMSIGAEAFVGCRDLKVIELPAGVEQIGKAAFYGCSSLTMIEFPQGLKKIDDDMMRECASLTFVKIPDTVTSIGTNAFNKCSSLKQIELPSKLETIGGRAFSICSALTEITIPDGVTTIVNGTFDGCGKLEKVNLPDTLTKIEQVAFRGCSSLESIKIPKNTQIEVDDTFSDAGLKTIYGFADSPAETYATNKGYEFITLTQLTADEVKTVIEALPTKITLEHKLSVRSSRELYEQLSENEKDSLQTQYMDILQKLTAAEETIAQLEIKAVQQAIDAIPEAAEITCSNKTAVKVQIKEVKQAYAALTDDQKESVGEDLVNKMELAEQKIEQLETGINQIKAAIAALPYGKQVTFSDKAKVAEVRAMYEDLTLEQQTQISSTLLRRLTLAEEWILELEAEIAAAEGAFAALPDCTQIRLADKMAVEAARAKYEELADDQKEAVREELFDRLTAAEERITELEAEMEAAKNAVKNAVSNLPNLSDLTINDKAAVEAAKAAYEALTDEQKAQISDGIVSQLNEAVRRLAELEKAEKEKETETEHTHVWSGWKTTAKATVFAAEVQTRTCSCGAAETRTAGKKLTAVLELPGKLKSFSIKKGKTKTFAVTMANGDSVKSVQSGASKTLKATLDKKTGKITLKALKTGTVKLTIKLASSESRTYTVKVTNSTIKTTALSVTSVKNRKLTLAKGKTHSLKTTVKPFTSTQKVTYTSSNKKVATVTSAGKIKAVAAGKATITVKSGSKSVKLTVTVPGITNLKSSVTVKKGKTLTLSPKLCGISGKVTYVSSNKKIATVTAKGKVKGIKKGTAKITVKAGSYTRTVTVKVK